MTRGGLEKRNIPARKSEWFHGEGIQVNFLWPLLSHFWQCSFGKIAGNEETEV